MVYFTLARTQGYTLWLRETMKDREPGRLQSMGAQRVSHNLATEQQ